VAFPDYYHAELAYYRDLAQEFAQSYPEVAYLVSERRSDEAVERMLQGSALLTARIRYRLDDDFPEVIHPLFDAMWPQYLRATPSLSLLKFTPLPNVLRQTQTIPRGTEVRSRAVDGIECSFLTTSSVELPPVELTEARLDRAHPADLQLRLAFSLTGGATFDTAKIARIRLQLLGEPKTRYSLHHWLTRYLRHVSIATPDGRVLLTLPPRSIRQAGFSDEETLCPFQPIALRGLRLVQEFMGFPDKFLAVELSGLERIPVEGVSESFEVWFHLGTPPDGSLDVDASHFALACTPIVNLSLPEQVDLHVPEGASVFRLKAPSNGRIFSLERVGAYDIHSGEWTEYQPFFAKSLTQVQEHQLCFQLLRRSDGVVHDELYLSIIDRDGHPVRPNTETLNVRLTYTNGDRPLKLGVGDIDVATSSSPQFVRFANIQPAVPPAEPHLGEERHWQLLALFSIHPQDLMSTSGLHLLLKECQRILSLDRPPPSITEVRAHHGTRLHRRTVAPVTRVEIDVDETSFVCAGEIHLFAQVLEALYLHGLEAGSFREVVVRGQPSGAVYLGEV
jgi:type VI secretion system protein ImpG